MEIEQKPTTPAGGAAVIGPEQLKKFLSVLEEYKSGKVRTEQLTLLNSSMTIDGYVLLPVKTEFLAKNEKFTTLRMTLYEGRNRQIRKMCAEAGLKVAKLTRVAIGSITLGNLEGGKWRYLTNDEVKTLKK